MRQRTLIELTGDIVINAVSTIQSEPRDMESAAAQIRQRMSVIRRHIGEDVDGIVQNAQQLTDWHHYVRTFPWISVASAAAVGFIAVPRRLEVVRPKAGEIARLAKRERLVVTNQPASEARSSLASTAMTLIGSALLRGAAGYIATNIGSLIGKQVEQEEALPQ